MTATFTFASPDAGPGATFECSLDSGPFVAVRVAAHLQQPADGDAHVRGPRARRERQRRSDAGDAHWYVDLTPPETTIDSGPSGAVALASASFTFTSNEDSVFTCSLDGAPFAACTSPANYPGLAQGAHTFAVRATDWRVTSRPRRQPRPGPSTRSRPISRSPRAR